MKKILLLAVLIIISVLSVKAAELVVKGSEAADIRNMSTDLFIIAKSIMPCMEKQDPNTYIYQRYYACVCEAHNQLAIIGFKKLNTLYKKHPHWANYSYVKTEEYTDANGVKSSYSFDMAAYKKMLNALKPCIE